MAFLRLVLSSPCCNWDVSDIIYWRRFSTRLLNMIWKMHYKSCRHVLSQNYSASRELL